MKKKKRSHATLLIAAPLLFAACFAACGIFDTESDTAYYGVEADGYVFFAHTKKPVAGAIVGVRTGFPSHGWATKEAVDERYIADSNGYYRIRFFRRVDGQEPSYWTMGISVPKSETEKYYYVGWQTGVDTLWTGSELKSFSEKTLISTQTTIRIDTAWVYLTH
jgi:hypothetical protein